MNTADCFDQADVLLLIGSNTTESHPIIANRMKKARKNGLKIIVIDPRVIDMVKVSELHLQLKVGTDIALLNAMVHVILKEDLYDSNFIKRTTTGIDNLKEQVKNYTPEFAEKITGVSKDLIIETARVFANAKNAMIAYTLGITEHHKGVNNVLALSNLALLTGHIGRPGNGIMPLRGQNNVQGAGDMGCLPNQLTGGQSLNDPIGRKRFESEWDITLSTNIGSTQTQIIEKMDRGDVKALYVIGENPVVADVNKSHTSAVFKKLDFLIVQDIFLTETAQMADVVLPARSWAEVDGTVTNTERRIQRVRQALQPLDGTREDWQILCELSTKLGYPMHYETSEEIWEEVRKLAPHMYGGMPYERLDRENGLLYPCPDESHPGTTFLHERFHSETFTGNKAPFTSVNYTAPLEEPNDEYPFILTTGRRYESYNTHTQTKYYADGFKVKQTEETVDIHPDDAMELGIEDGDYVEVSSRRGQVHVKTKVTNQVAPGLVFMSFHFADVPTNFLTLDKYDPVSGTAEYKACAVRIKPLN